MTNSISQSIKNSATSEYINTQNFNGVTRFLHSIRYAHVQNFLQSVLNKNVKNIQKLKSNANTITSTNITANPSIQKAKLSLLEIGCGYGKSLQVIKQNANLPIHRYLGIDIEADFIKHCQQQHSCNDSFHSSLSSGSPISSSQKEKIEFIHADIREYASKKRDLSFHPNAIIALECFEHMNEYDIPLIIDWIASLDCPLFISVPNEIGPAILLKNIGSWLMGYTRFKEYSLSDTLNAAIFRLEKLPKHETGHIGFDWRWLLSVLKQRFIVTNIGTSPFSFIPRFLSPSIYFYCVPIDIDFKNCK